MQSDPIEVLRSRLNEAARRIEQSARAAMGKTLALPDLSSPSKHHQKLGQVYFERTLFSFSSLVIEIPAEYAPLPHDGGREVGDPRFRRSGWNSVTSRKLGGSFSRECKRCRFFEIG